MLKQIIAAAVLSTALVAGAAAPAFAGDDGSESTFWQDRANKIKMTNKDGSSKTLRTTKKKGQTKIIHRDAKGKVTKVERKVKSKRSSMTARNSDGSTRTVRDNGDGTRTIIDRGPDGRITGRRTVGRTPDFAHNHTTGVTAIGVGGGVRVVIGPFGFSFSN